MKSNHWMILGVAACAAAVTAYCCYVRNKPKPSFSLKMGKLYFVVYKNVDAHALPQSKFLWPICQRIVVGFLTGDALD